MYKKNFKIISIITIIFLVIATLLLIRVLRKDNNQNKDTSPSNNTNPIINPIPSNNNSDNNKKFSPGDYDFSLVHDGLTRTYEVHVPKSYDKNKETPVIINIHGGGGSAKSARKESQMDKTSELKGFIVVYPNAAENNDNRKKWNNGPRLIEPEKQGSYDDIGFFNKMLDDLESKFNIDKKRIYVTGMSNGGMMTYRVGCEMSNRISAIAPVASTMLINNCSPVRPISIIHFHGLKDKYVPFKGGPSDDSVLNAVIFEGIRDNLKSVEDSISTFVEKNNCSQQPKTTFQNGGVICKTYSPCNENSEVTLCTIEDGGHTWPGGAYPIDMRWYKNLVGLLSTDISANDMMWEFFQRHPMP